MKCEWLLNVRYMANRPKKEMLPEAERHIEFDAGVNEIKQIWAHMKNFSQYCASCLGGKKNEGEKKKEKRKKRKQPYSELKSIKRSCTAQR